ncbi:glycosyltransferase [Arthrobacter sp. B1805]|uniref:glycosyltransferase n=1 Tax=Arthrobacter sp. B1805 TaxID=2058892 RepID=UPI000CE3A081|nr:glycosyltransferase [Arthrobacter sp. B1805]
MASYNGSAHVVEQLESILAQLGPEDEIVVVDDASTDSSVDVIAGLEDGRIRLIRSPANRGYVRTFEAALLASRGQYIFLSDQDDIWLPGRLELMLGALSASPVVASNFSFFGQPPRAIESLRLKADDSTKKWTNLLLLWIGVRPYYGCAMAFRRDAAPLILPFPAFLHETHDQWIAMVGNLAGGMQHLEQDTLSRRLHDTNTTPKKVRSPLLILRARIMLARAFLVAVQRVRRYRNQEASRG